MQVERLPVRIEPGVNGAGCKEGVECLLPLRVGAAARKIEDRRPDLHHGSERLLTLLCGAGIQRPIEEHAPASQLFWEWVSQWDRPKKRDRADFIARIRHTIPPPTKGFPRLPNAKELGREHHLGP